MIPSEITEFLNHRGLAMMIGTRDQNLQPSVCRGYGVKVNEAGTIVSVFISKSRAEKILNNIQQNGRIAFTAVDPMKHHSYQFKGQYISHEDCNEHDHTILMENMMGFGKFIVMAFGEQMLPVLQQIQVLPVVSIAFKVETIFNQTPGPGAGKKIN